MSPIFTTTSALASVSVTSLCSQCKIVQRSHPTTKQTFELELWAGPRFTPFPFSYYCFASMKIYTLQKDIAQPSVPKIYSKICTLSLLLLILLMIVLMILDAAVAILGACAQPQYPDFAEIRGNKCIYRGCSRMQCITMRGKLGRMNAARCGRGCAIIRIWELAIR